MQHEVPAPNTRVPASMYLELRGWMIANDPDAQELVDWAETVQPPQTAEDLAADIIWIILCAGRSAQAARTIEKRVWNALDAGKSAFEAFGYRAKALAIDRAWKERREDFAALQRVLSTGSVERLLEWCRSIPFIGEDTQYQLAKNIGGGADFCKPDIWLCRLAGFPDKPRRAVHKRFEACMALCRPLAEASGDRIATVDTMLWLACNKHVLIVDSNAGPVRYAPRATTVRSIMEAAPD